MDSKEQLIREVSSPINSKLRIVQEAGKKLLNTENTNYSFGTLVDVLEEGLDNIPLGGVESVLLLGMGGGSIIHSLREKYDCHAPVTAVDIDPVVINLAYEEFQIDQLSEVSIHEADAQDFIENCKDAFDLIIIDIYIDVDVPEKFYEAKFWEMIEKNVNSNGFILFNAGIDMSDDKAYDFLERLPASFIYQEMYNVLESNTVFIMQKVF